MASCRPLPFVGEGRAFLVGFVREGEGEGERQPHPSQSREERRDA
jgi:hypothetical protein